MAVAWLAEGTDRPFGAQLRFDGVAILLDSAGDLVCLDHLEAAF
jgi:putative endonuclease